MLAFTIPAITISASVLWGVGLLTLGIVLGAVAAFLLIVSSFRPSF